MWRSVKNSIKIHELDLANHDVHECAVCCTASENCVFFSFDLIYDLIEHSSIGILNWSNDNYFCSECCELEGNNLTEEGTVKIMSKSNSKEVNNVSQFPLGKMTLKENDEFHTKKIRKNGSMNVFRPVKECSIWHS